MTSSNHLYPHGEPQNPVTLPCMPLEDGAVIVPEGTPWPEEPNGRLYVVICGEPRRVALPAPWHGLLLACSNIMSDHYREMSDRIRATGAYRFTIAYEVPGAPYLDLDKPETVQACREFFNESARLDWEQVRIVRTGGYDMANDMAGIVLNTG